MSFFNKREEVINIQLTRFGRESIMKGKFEPVFYRFFDDGVIYDSAWAGFEEVQNAAEDRIKEAPVSKPQSAFVGVETALERDYNTRNQGDHSIDRFYEPLNEDADEEERVYSLRNPLFSGKVGSDKTPGFRVVAMTEPFSGSLTYSTGSGENIPEAKIKFESVTIVSENQGDDPDSVFEPIIDDVQTFEGGVSYATNNEPLVFSVQETNVASHFDGFEIEIFEDISGSLVQMYFDHEDENRLISEYFEILIDDEAQDLGLDMGMGQDFLPPMFSRRRFIDPITRLTNRSRSSAGGTYTSLPSDEDVEDCES